MSRLRRRITPVSRSKKRLVRRSTPRRPSMMMGLGYAPSSSHSVVKKDKKKTFQEKVADFMYPPYTVKSAIPGGYDTSTAAYGLVGANSQHVNFIACMNVGDFATLCSKARDAYYTSSTNGDTAIPTNADANTWKNQAYQHKLKSLYWRLTMVNTCSATTEFEVLWLTPNRFIHDSESTNVTDPVLNWQQCNTHAQLAINSNPALPTGGALNIAQPGDRPYKNSTKYEFSRYWKILAKDNFVLEPGISKKVAMSFAQNKTVAWEDMVKYDAIPYVTLYCIIISKGQVNNGTTAGFNDVNYSDHQYSYIQDRTVTLSVKNIKRRVVFKDTASLTNVLPANQVFYNDDTRTTVGYTENV